eukprot:CAMPEP_0184058740 /NCGR_PEP_ID=MMETSP0956-20121227/9478_1 /TAXON_ID=627963 /ORGANISM="Aplanochytrium sp, Strain PBS07" /LENGTH=254 /DNA_ID=CAMNT_0026353865 /DNA_START=103 /DNA_END=864 /DNA_ORIENTATION=+
MDAVKNYIIKPSFLRTSSRSSAAAPPRNKDITPSTGLMKEGYLMKRSRNGGSNWRRRFFVLTHDAESGPDTYGVLCYSEDFKAQAESKAIFSITGKSSVRYTTEFEDAGYDGGQCLEIIPPEDATDRRPLIIASSDRQAVAAWKIAIEACIAKSRGERVVLDEVIGRFHEGILFKTNKAADTWQQRHCELHGTQLWWFHGPGEELRGKVSLIGAKVTPRKTEADSAPTNFVFQIAAKERTLNLAAPNEAAYLDW